MTLKKKIVFRSLIVLICMGVAAAALVWNVPERADCTTVRVNGIQYVVCDGDTITITTPTDTKR